jgi:hypothetical protein
MPRPTVQMRAESPRSTHGARPSTTAARKASPPPAATIAASSEPAWRAADTSGRAQMSVAWGDSSTSGTGSCSIAGTRAESEVAAWVPFASETAGSIIAVIAAEPMSRAAPAASPATTVRRRVRRWGLACRTGVGPSGSSSSASCAARRVTGTSAVRGSGAAKGSGVWPA